MILTRSQAFEAEIISRKQRFSFASMLTIDEGKASPEDMKLWSQIQDAMKDPERFDKALAHPSVNNLFSKGILKFDPSKRRYERTNT